MAWTVTGTRVGLLALDRSGDGVIDGAGELLGQAVSGLRRPEGGANSFADLAAFDRPDHGGNGDGAIDAADAVLVNLRIWVDLNHDGVSQPGELLTLPQAGIASIELGAQPIGRRDRYGNVFRSRADVHLINGHQTTVWDVFLVARLPPGAAAAAGVAWPGPDGPRPVAAGVAGLGATLLAVGLVGVRRTRRDRRGPWDPRVGALLLQASPRARLFPAAVVRAGVTGAAAVAVVLLWPAATFGEGSPTWQVVEYYDTDAVGSIRVVTDGQGQVVARHDFLPFGEELNPQHEPPDKRLYTGQERDFETGQDYFGARQLRTDLGRFLAPDPITLVPRVVGAPGINSYVYVRNNPLRYIDPNGLDARALENQPKEYSDWTPTMLFGGNDDGWADGLFEMVDYRQAEATAQAYSLAVLVPAEVKTTIELSIKASNSATADDLKGGFHEESLKWGADASDALVVSRSKAGAYAPPGTNPETSFESANPALDAKFVRIDGFAHVHPKGDQGRRFNQGPSTRDIEIARLTPTTINIVVGAENKRVYFYNGSGLIGASMKLTDFLGGGR